MSSKCVNDAMMSSEDLLDTHIGSVHIMSNLYVEGFVFEGKYGGCSNATIIDTPLILTGPVTFCNDMTFLGSNVNIVNPLHVHVSHEVTWTGAPVAFLNEEVTINKLIVDQLELIRIDNIKAPVFSSLSNTYVHGSFSNYLGPVSEYNEQYQLSIASSNIPTDHQSMMLGNGKLAVFPKHHGPGMDECYITIGPQFVNGAYDNNVLQTFTTANLSFWERSDAVQANTGIIHSPGSNNMNMQTGILHTELDVVKDNLMGIHLNIDTYTVRQLPFCCILSAEITPTTPLINYLDVFLEMKAPIHLDQVVFNNNTIYNESVQNAGLHILIGTAQHPTAGSVVCMTACVFDNTQGLTIENLGFNVSRKDMRTAFNKFRISKNDGNLLTIDQSFTMHFLSVCMTSFDFPNPVEEAKRIIMTVVCKELASSSLFPMRDYVRSVVKAREIHVRQWNDIWKHSCNICPKMTATAMQKNRIVNVRKAMRIAYYNLFSCIRENVNLGINRDSLPIIDLNGQFLYELDIWLIPFILMFLPNVAKAMIEYRFHTANAANQLASSYGFEGYKFPSSTDILGYKNALYFDPYASLSLFNSAYVAINAWNYYRVTRDKDWLSRIGYSMIKGVATFIESMVENVEGPDGIEKLRIKNIVGLELKQSPGFDNAFSVNLAKLVFRYCIEASYEMYVPLNPNWSLYAQGLEIPTYDGALRDIIKYDDNINTPTSVAFQILEPLAALIPQLSSEFFGDEMNRVSNTIERNVEFYNCRSTPEYAKHPYNMGLVALGYTQAMQINPNYVDIFDNALHSFIDNSQWGVWHNFRAWGEDVAKFYDLSSGCIFLYLLSHGIGGVRIQGGVAETRFYYEEMKVNWNVTANMPSYWKELQFCKLGTQPPASIRVINNTLL